MENETGNLEDCWPRSPLLAGAIVLIFLALAGGQCQLRLSVASAAAKGREHPETEYGTPTPDVVYEDGFCESFYGPATTAWVLYLIDDSTVNGTQPRQQFREAIDVPGEFRPRLSYYSDWNAKHPKDPIDKGHWFDAKDAAYSPASESACFEARNLSPQAKRLNEGPWRWLEDRIRGYWKPGTRIFVCCGPLWAPLDGKTSYEVRMVGTIPMAPQHFKTVLVDDGKSLRMEAWIFANRNDNLPTLDQARVAVDVLEQKARLDFWSGLPDDVEAKLEAVK